jgi:LysR family glycine cleavage system transcriptional activator
MQLPSLNAIRVFETAARLGSLKDAASEMGLTPSAVSRHIRALEDALGTELFTRGFREVTLTTRGEDYAHRLTEAFRIIETATEDASVRGQIRPNRARYIVLSGESSFVNLWLVDRLAKFRQLHPQIEFDISIATFDDNPKADLSIFSAFEEKNDPALKPLLPLYTMAVCAPSLLRAGRKLRMPADLIGHRLLHEGTTAWWEKWLAEEGVTAIDVKGGAVFHDPALAMREAVNGGGIALADTIMAEDLMKSGQLVTPFPIRHRLKAGYYLKQRPSAGSKPGVREFRAWLFAEIEQHKRDMRLL